jgi:hypothetical protein
MVPYCVSACALFPGADQKFGEVPTSRSVDDSTPPAAADNHTPSDDQIEHAVERVRRRLALDLARPDFAGMAARAANYRRDSGAG